MGYIKANSDVEKKMDAMKLFKSYNFKKTYNHESIFSCNEEELKLGYINIDNIFSAKSIDFLNEDTNLLILDFLIVTDTRLQEDTYENIVNQKLTNWNIEARFDSPDKLRHMGMLVLKSKQMNQDISATITSGTIVCIYKSYSYLLIIM